MLSFFPIFIILTYFHTSDSATTTQLPETVEKVEFLVTNKTQIWRVDQTGNKHRYSTNTSAIGDVDYHLQKRILFWIDTNKREIHSQSLDLNVTAYSMIFKQKGNWEPIALAIDFINDKVYAVDAVGVKIDVFELDGRYQSIVLGSDIVRPIDIKLDPYESLMFVLDGFRIVRTNMDGSNMVTVIRQGITTLHGFVLDVIDKKIYWSRNTDFIMMSANYSGESVSSGRNSSSFKFYTKFAVFNDTIYWASNYVQFKSECCDEKLGSKRKSIYQSNPVPTIKAIHSSLQISSLNPCAKQNGGCQHFCILKSKNNSNITHRCACRVGWKLADNMKNCTLVDNFLIYAQRDVMKSHLIENCTTALCEPYLPIGMEHSRFIDFDYDESENYLYYIVKILFKYYTIYRMHPNESDSEVFLDGSKQGNIQSLSIDSVTRNLYYVDSFEGSVNVIKIDNKTNKVVLLKNLENPEDINIHSSYIFFLQTNKTSKLVSLSRANVDGTNLKTFDNVQLKKQCGYVIDINTDKIYLYDWNKKYIQIANLNMEELEKMENKWTEYIHTIDIFEQWIYVVTSDSEGIRRFDKTSGERAELIVPDFSNRIAKAKVFSIHSSIKNKNNPCAVHNGGCADFCFALASSNSSWIKNCVSAN